MVNYCCVPECTNSAITGNISMHLLPLEKNLRQKWIAKIRRDKSQSTPVSKYMRVCSAHFKNSDYIKNHKHKKLVKGAVPSVFSFGPAQNERKKPFFRTLPTVVNNKEKMIQQYISHLAQRKVILASGSPRRKAILKDIGLTLKVVPSSFEENLELADFSSVYEFAIETARCKALEVWNRLELSKVKPDLIISADTVVHLDGETFPKPRYKENAKRMLEKLSGRTHQVVTGVALLIADYTKEDVEFEVKTFHEETEVDFCVMTPEMIQSYVDTDEPLDKAGGYGIQGVGGTFVKGIRGDYFNVVGFPLHKFCCEVQKLCSEKLL